MRKQPIKPLETFMVMVYNAPDSPELFGQVARHADLAQAGVDLYKISRLLEHKDIKVIQRYACHCPDSLSDGVGKGAAFTIILPVDT